MILYQLSGFLDILLVINYSDELAHSGEPDFYRFAIKGMIAA